MHEGTEAHNQATRDRFATSEETQPPEQTEVSTADADAAPEPEQEPQAQRGGDVSTAPPTAPPPPPGVPAQPVNAGPRKNEVPGPRMNTDWIGEATSR